MLGNTFAGVCGAHVRLPSIKIVKKILTYHKLALVSHHMIPFQVSPSPEKTQNHTFWVFDQWPIHHSKFLQLSYDALSPINTHTVGRLTTENGQQQFATNSGNRIIWAYAFSVHAGTGAWGDTKESSASKATNCMAMLAVCRWAASWEAWPGPGRE